jgi:hypothetical protein
MLHGPCGAANPSAPCMKNNTCTKQYPRPYNDDTLFNQDGYPIYKRRQDGRCVYRNGHCFTNQHVVPYNPYLTGKYDCHINIEVASTIFSVKYLFKYVYKGHDRSAVIFRSESNIHSSAGRPDDVERQAQRTLQRDETKQYLDARYISASESCWRLFAFHMHQHSPSVIRLQLHLPEQQYIQFEADGIAVDVIRRRHVRTTMLTAFFDICRQKRKETEGLLYCDAPSALTWDQSAHV